ncbi:GNAT family N-acetyltransferase [Xanthomarina gelatinilytica]|uniref:GNAT family N-acetyltransferase n=1 Tax=Xanthomarina gelatinilytica TaxID=1137281 RepID=UPI003AA830A3
MSRYSIKIKKEPKRDVYYVLNNENQIVHRSFVFKKVHLLKLIKTEGRVIGGCFTPENYRGQGLYPFILNTIGREYFETNDFNLYIIVDKTNLASIRGIEKSGFKRVNSITTKRFGIFYFNTNIEYI